MVRYDKKIVWSSDTVWQTSLVGSSRPRGWPHEFNWLHNCYTSTYAIVGYVAGDTAMKMFSYTSSWIQNINRKQNGNKGANLNDLIDAMQGATLVQLNNWDYYAN